MPTATKPLPRLPSLLCPVDFSEHSRAALRYAGAIADHFGAHLTVMTVDDPLLAEAAAATGRVPSLEVETLYELKRFCSETLTSAGSGPTTIHCRAAVGKPAAEILRVVNELQPDLIVMSSHGRSGIQKIFFGSTTERVLRETTVPVLVTPDDRGPMNGLSERARLINRIVAPVDLTPASAAQLRVAGGIAQALSVPLIVAHVLEPIFVAHDLRAAIPGVETTRQACANERLAAIISSLPAAVRTEAGVLTGEPAEEISKLAEARQANLIVMGLHASGLGGPRMGSVTYRVLCLTHALVLALPPTQSGAPGGDARRRLS
jgi:nucleotide-binding universal stress UspA family protein